MRVLGAVLFGVTVTLVTLALAIFYIVMFVIGIGWLTKKIEELFKEG